MGKVIRGCQHAFMKGRQILNTASIANEVVDGILEAREEEFFANWIWKRPMITWLGNSYCICWTDWYSRPNGVIG